MLLKLSRSTNSAATGVWWRRARTSICSARSRISARFGQSRQGVVGGHERELLIRSLALAVKRLGDLNEAELETLLEHVQGLGSVSDETSSCDAICCSTSATASRQHRQCVITSLSDAAR